MLFWEGCQEVINLSRVRAEAHLWYTSRQGEGAQLVLGVSSFLLQTVSHLCTYSSHCLEWVNKEREDITHFSDGVFFIIPQAYYAFPQECARTEGMPPQPILVLPLEQNPLHMKGLQCQSMIITCDIWVKSWITCTQQGSMDTDITSVTAQN